MLHALKRVGFGAHARKHGPKKTSIITATGVVLALALSGPVIAPRIALAASCSESTKFVEEVANNPDTGNTQYYGIQGSTWVYNHLPICSGGETAQSFFMRLSPDYLNWVETGIRQYPSDSSSHSHAWGEWRYYPAPEQVHNYDSEVGVLTTGTFYSVNLQNGPGTSWDLYIAHTSLPGSNWHHLANTGNLISFTGIPESEFARFDDGNADDLVNYLQDQYYYLGPFHDWQHMECDRSQDSITDWTVNRLTSSSWEMLPGSPGTGC